MKRFKRRFYKIAYTFFYRRWYQLVKPRYEHGGWKVKTIKVTDHALHRYIERVKGISIDDCIADMVSENLDVRVARLGQGDYPVNGFRVRVLNNTVVTVLDREKTWRGM